MVFVEIMFFVQFKLSTYDKYSTLPQEFRFAYASEGSVIGRINTFILAFSVI
jgi:hypothetical protein